MCLWACPLHLLALIHSTLTLNTSPPPSLNTETQTLFLHRLLKVKKNIKDHLVQRFSTFSSRGSGKLITEIFDLTTFILGSYCVGFCMFFLRSVPLTAVHGLEIADLVQPFSGSEEVARRGEVTPSREHQDWAWASCFKFRAPWGSTACARSMGCRWRVCSPSCLQLHRLLSCGGISGKGER